MKMVIIGLIGLFSLTPNTREIKNIQETISSLFIASDTSAWHQAERAFAPSVVLDYASMNGIAASEVTPKANVKSWKRILPGLILHIIK